MKLSVKCMPLEVTPTISNSNGAVIRGWGGGRHSIFGPETLCDNRAPKVMQHLWRMKNNNMAAVRKLSRFSLTVISNETLVIGNVIFGMKI